MEINKDNMGHLGQLFRSPTGRYICVCPFCSGRYAYAFAQGKYRDDGFLTKEDAVSEWNNNHREV